MFDKMQYVIEETRSYIPGHRETYKVKDINGDLLGYAKWQRLRDNFWFEGTNGTRLCDIRAKGGKIRVDRYEVYDAQNQLRGTIRPVVRANEKRKFRLGIALMLSGIPLMLLALLGLQIGVEELFTVGFFGGMALSVFGLIYIGFMAAKGEIGRQEWQIEDSEDRKLVGLPHKILTPDGDVLIRIQMKRSLIPPFPSSWSIDISRQDFEPILILSYIVLMAHRSKPPPAWGGTR